jgi:outer membrane receptor protein involved in Fe transport
LMIDGIDQGEHLFQDIFWGNHYPIENVDRIEIIRGGGSVLYGGSAEYAVINLISRTGAQINGVQVAGVYGQGGHGLDRQNLTVTGGTAFDNGLDVMASAMIGQGKRSDRTYSDFYGNNTDFAASGVNTLNPLYLNVGASFKGLKARLEYDHYDASDVDASGLTFLDAKGNPFSSQQSFTSTMGDVLYELKLGDRLTITPRVTFWDQQPWRVSDPTDPGFYDKQTIRWDGKLIASYRVIDGLHVNLGTDAYTEHAWVNHPELAGTGYQTLFAGSPVAKIQDIAGFGEIAWDSEWVNLNAGARYESNSAIGTALVPRFAATKVLGKFHGKLLFSQAFRAPAFEEIALSDPTIPLHPEKTSLTEAEIGYAFTENAFARVNVFDMIVSNTLTYVVDPKTLVQTFGNSDRTGTRGIEAEIRFKSSLGYSTLTYSFYTGAGINLAQQFAVPGQISPLLAYPQHKVTWAAHFNLGDGFSFNPNVMLYSTRWGYLTQDGTNTGVGVLSQTPAGALVNFFVDYRPPSVPGIEVGAGLYNAFDDGYSYVVAYASGHAPLPAPGRTFLLRASYALGL